MIRDAERITVNGTLNEDGRIQPDEPLPLQPGRVEVTVRPIGADEAEERPKLRLLDLAGSAREALRDVDVDGWLDDLRNEWDRKTG